MSLRASPPATSWIELDVPFRPAEEEDVAAALAACGSVGAWTVRPRLARAYFGGNVEGVEARFRAAWRESTGTEWEGPLSARRTPDRDWLRHWRESVGPVRVTPTLWIAPPGDDGGTPAGARVVVIQPGQGFGTGSHPTTRALLRWIEAEPGRRVLDVGCGSGVLGIAALLLGARRAVGLDVDPDALANAAENRDRNRAADRLALVQGTLDAIAAVPVFDRVVANLDRTALAGLAAPLVARCAPGGRLGVAGLLAEERDGFLAALASLPVEVEEERTEEDDAGGDAWWSAWIARREGS